MCGDIAEPFLEAAGEVVVGVTEGWSWTSRIGAILLFVVLAFVMLGIIAMAT